MPTAPSNTLPKTHYAYPHNPNLEVVMRMSAVKRWHMIDTTRTQTLAEHTANVSLLAWLIAQTSPMIHFDPGSLLLGAMVHDLAEAFLGDIPTHSKPLIGKEAISSAEATVLPVIFQRAVLKPGSPEHELLKLCDIADGIRFIRLHGVDVTARHAQQGLESQWAGRLSEAREAWPDNVWCHVFDHLNFYAYESQAPGIRMARGRRKDDAGPLVDDMARKPCR